MLKKRNPPIEIKAENVRVGDTIVSGRFYDRVNDISSVNGSVVLRCNDSTTSIIRRETEMMLVLR